MRLVTFEEYLEFASRAGEVVVEGRRIPLRPLRVSRLEPTEEEEAPTGTTVWSFPRRGSWATHRGDYRGNWAPQVPRALMLMYTRPGDLVVDPMAGSGTTCVEAKLLGRSCVGVDINYGAVMLALHRLYYLERALERVPRPSRIGGVDAELIDRAWHRIYHGDARRLDEIEDGGVDLVATHPPYWNIIEYKGEECEPGDLSCARGLEEYLELLGQVADEIRRILRPGGHAGILVGDTRARRHYVPISHHVLNVFLERGFVLREEVIKIQHNMKTTREVWSRVRRRDFLLIAHEKLYVFRKPSGDEREHRYSMKLRAP